jgi:hypothetical protein
MNVLVPVRLLSKPRRNDQSILAGVEVLVIGLNFGVPFRCGHATHSHNAPRGRRKGLRNA